MSTNIPVNMRLDDLLKATGYNCPVELQGKTFDEATSGGGGGEDISLTTTTLEGFIGSSYGIILCDENGVPLKVDNIATFDLTKIKYIYEGQEYSGTMHDLTEVSDLHWDSEGSQLIWNDEANTVYLDSTESTAYPLIKFLRHNFD